MTFGHVVFVYLPVTGSSLQLAIFLKDSLAYTSGLQLTALMGVRKNSRAMVIDRGQGNWFMQRCTHDFPTLI